MSTYVYGFVRADHPAVPEDTTGVGDPPADVRTVTEGDLAALVSEAPEELRPKRRDLIAHQQVLVAADVSGGVLPLRFRNLWRAQGRRVRLDLKNFSRFLTLRGEATGGWRGEIRDGELVRSHEDAELEEQEYEEYDEEQPEDEEGEYEPEDEYERAGR